MSIASTMPRVLKTPREPRSPKTQGPRRLLAWPRRPRIEETDLARRRFWVSQCGGWMIEHAISHYGLPDIWRIYRRREGACGAWWAPVGRRRARKAAFKTAEQAAKREAASQPTRNGKATDETRIENRSKREAGK